MTALQQVITLIVALVCFLLAAFGYAPTRDRGRVGLNLVAFGLALWVLVPLVAAVKAA